MERNRRSWVQAGKTPWHARRMTVQGSQSKGKGEELSRADKGKGLADHRESGEKRRQGKASFVRSHWGGKKRGGEKKGGEHLRLQNRPDSLSAHTGEKNGEGRRKKILISGGRNGRELRIHLTKNRGSWGEKKGEKVSFKKLQRC